MLEVVYKITSHRRTVIDKDQEREMQRRACLVNPLVSSERDGFSHRVSIIKT